MPIYDFRCWECDKVSEIFLRSANDQVVRCPAAIELSAVKRLLLRRRHMPKRIKAYMQILTQEMYK